MFAEKALRRRIRYPGHTSTLASGLDAVRHYVARCHAESLELFGSFGAGEPEPRCETPAGRPITVWKWLLPIVEHAAHHRGQLYLGARMRGSRVEPLSGLIEGRVAAPTAAEKDG